MARSLIPYLFGDLPWNEEGFELSPFTGRSSDITISEDAKYINVQMPLPGVQSENVEVTFDGGVLCVKGSQEEKEEDKKKKYYRRAKSTFSYSVRVPGNLDEKTEPEASLEKGLMTVSFKKKTTSKPNKITVKKK